MCDVLQYCVLMQIESSLDLRIGRYTSVEPLFYYLAKKLEDDGMPCFGRMVQEL